MIRTPQSTETRAGRLRLPVWLLTAVLLAVAAGWILRWASPLQAAILAVALMASAAAGSFTRRGAEAELLAEIERRKEAEEQSRAANQVKSEFLANMSHELRTPLTAIIGSADLLLGAELSAEDRRHVEVVDNSAESLLALIDDILDFAKLEAGRLRLETADFRLRELVDGVRRMVAPAAAEKDLELEVEVDPDVPEALRGDPSRLRQILVNLASNAVKFTDRGRVGIRVEVTSTEAEPRIRFTVRDTGIGISPAEQRRIFETFYQVDNTSMRRFSGSGLGLSISKELIRRMGGEFGLESEPRVGSTFWVNLPLELAHTDVPNAEQGKAAVVSKTVDRGRFRILVVDDEPINRRLALAHLTALGYGAEAAEDGKTALSRLPADSFDAVLMDCQMATIDGYETAHRWRRMEKERAREGEAERTPIVALTARALPGEREKCLASGMDDYLTKPYRGADLERVLGRWLHVETDEAKLDDSSPSSEESFEERIGALRRLGEVTGEDVLGPAIQSFSTEATERLGEMHSAFESREADALATAAHGLIAVSGALGAERLVGLLRQIEEQALEGRLEDLEELLEAVKTAVERFSEKLGTIQLQ